MPDTNAALGKRNFLDASDDRPARKWYRAQYVDIAIQTDSPLAEDAPTSTNSGTVTVSVADVNGMRSQTTPKILVTSTTTSNDSPTVGSRLVPRAYIEQRTDVAPFPASPKDSAPTPIVSPSRAASHMKAAETSVSVLSAPVLAMSSSEWMPSTAVTDATSAVPFLNVSTSAPMSPTSATCTPSHGVHNAPVLTSRLSGPTPPSPSRAWTALAVSSEFSHSDHDVRSDTSPSSFISSHGPTLATPSTPTDTTVRSHSSRSPPHGEEKPIPPASKASESLDRMNRLRELHHDPSSSDADFVTNSSTRLELKIAPAPEPGPSEQAEVALKRRTRRAGKHMREKKEKYRLKQLQLELSSSESKVDTTEELPESQRP